MASRVDMVSYPDASSDSVNSTTPKSELDNPIKPETNVEKDQPQEQKNARSRRFYALVAFAVIELLWLGFGLYVWFHNPTMKIRSFTFLNRTIRSDSYSQSTLQFIAGLYQTCTLGLAGGLVGEAFASEWRYLLDNPRPIATDTTSQARPGPVAADKKTIASVLTFGLWDKLKLWRNESIDKTSVDVVSLLTSGMGARLKHLINKNSSSVFSFALFASFLMILLHSTMTGVVTIGQAYTINGTSLTIGTLPSINTFDGTDANARNLQLAARDAYTSQIEDGILDVDVFTDSTFSHMFGVPNSDLLDGTFDYLADAIRYQYTCEWVAPQFVGFGTNAVNDITGSQWTIDSSGVVLTPDPLSFDIGNFDSFSTSLYGFWPLTNAFDFTPYNSGSLAWLLLGGNSSSPLSVINMTSIPSASVTFNTTGWFDLLSNNTEVTAYLTQIASVLVCDPQIDYRGGGFHYDSGLVSVNFIDQEEQGNQIDHTGAEWMFGMGLDGIPFDSILTQLPLFNATDASGAPLTDLSQLVFELTMNPPEASGLGATLQELGNISSSLNTYMNAVGPNVFFDGSLNTTTVSALKTKFDDDKQMFFNSMPYWWTSLSMILVISVLLTVMIVKEGRSVNKLTLAIVVKEVKEGAFD